VFVTEYSGREAAFGILRCAADPNGSWPPVSPAPGFLAAVLLARARSPSRSRIRSFLLPRVYLYITRSRVSREWRRIPSRGYRELACLVLVRCHREPIGIARSSRSDQRESARCRSSIQFRSIDRTAIFCLQIQRRSSHRWSTPVAVRSRRSIGAWAINRREGIPRGLVCVPSRSSVSEGATVRRGFRAQLPLVKIGGA